MDLKSSKHDIFKVGQHRHNASVRGCSVWKPCRQHMTTGWSDKWGENVNSHNAAYLRSTAYLHCIYPNIYLCDAHAVQLLVGTAHLDLYTFHGTPLTSYFNHLFYLPCCVPSLSIFEERNWTIQEYLLCLLNHSTSPSKATYHRVYQCWCTGLSIH